MKIKDPFSYSARWDSVGLDCSTCIYFSAPKTWPDKDKTISCKLHNISLRIELRNNCYKEGEWFCKDFTDNGKSHKKAIEEFKTIKDILDPKTLYKTYNEDKYLKEISFEEANKSL